MRTTESELHRLQQNNKKLRFAAGGVLAREGEQSPGWFVLLSGTVGVFKHDMLVTEFKDRGVIFGELASILEKPRTASLKALTPCEVVHFEASPDVLIREYPDIARKILVNVAERLAKTTDDLWSAVGHDPVPPGA